MAAPPRSTAAIRVENLTVSYRHHPAVHHLDCVFEPGSLTAVVGPNGAGKSSLLDALTGRVKPSTGRIHLPTKRRGDVAYLPQQSGVDRSFPLRVQDVVMLGAWPSLGVFRGASAAQQAQARQALVAVGLQGFEARLMSELSVGQFQRVLFARVMLQDAPVILLDEPFNAIDTRTTDDLMRLVQRWHAEGRTVIAVLHDLAQVREHFPRCLLLAREAVAFGATAQVLSTANLQRAQHMAAQWDEQADWCAGPSGRAVAAFDGAERDERRAAIGQRPMAFGRHEQSAGTVHVRPQPAKPARVPSGDRPTYASGEGQS